MISESTFWRCVVVIALLAIGLRVGLALVNTSANDNHFSVVQIIKNEGRIPKAQEAAEAFQPKLYYVTAATLLHLVPSEQPVTQIKAAQMLNVAAGILTLFVVIRFLGRAGFSRLSTLIVFALVALNPKLIGINAQVTNDSFVILFSALAMNAAVAFFSDHRSRDLIWMSVFSTLAALSKGNGLVILPLVVTTFAVDFFLRHRNTRPMNKAKLAASLAIFVLGFLVVVSVAGQYLERYRDHGSPFVINIKPSPWPDLMTKTEVRRPGVRSIADAFCTFRIIDLLRSPVITTQRPESYPEHRTSLWTQLYGRAHFVHFDQWPPAWRNVQPGMYTLGRAIFLLALLPTLLGIVGMVLIGAEMIKSLRAHRADALGQWVVVIGALGWIAFVMLYSLRFRDFSVMKFIFILPAIASWALFLGRGFELVLNGRHRDRWAKVLVAVVAALCVLYCVDIGWLIVQLA